MPKAFIDTNVFKFSAIRLRRLLPRTVTVPLGGRQHEVVVHELGYINPNEAILIPPLKQEVGLLPRIATLAKNNEVTLVTHFETQLEVSKLPNSNSETGLFFGASIDLAEDPVPYCRVIGGYGCTDWRDEQLRFLGSISHKRYLEIQRIVGAWQGKRGLNPNQLLDAFHLWCAESNRCEFFLTLDFRLEKVVRRSKKKLSVQVVCPSELLGILSPKPTS